MAELFTKVSCTYCQEDINDIRIQCCVCTDFDICIQCFANGAEIGPHKSDHSYKFVNNSAIKLFGGKNSWTGQEELLLLEGVEYYGFGAWEQVSCHVETRTAEGSEKVKEEYIARYLEGNIGKATWTEVANRRPILIDQVPEDNGPLSPTVTSRLPPLDITPEEARLLDYKPHRDDYGNNEYDVDAESLVSTLTLDTNEDSEMEFALKLSMVSMYTRRLRERARRKRTARDYQLVAKFFAPLRRDASKIPLTKDQRELRDKMRVFAQLFTSGEHERLISSIERERELRHRISELLRYRSKGLMTHEEIIHFEQHAAFERQQLKQNKSGSSGCAMLESPSKNGNESDLSFIEEKSTWLPDDELKNSYLSSSGNGNSGSDNSDITPSNALSLRSLLSQNELQLCSTLNLQPVHYVTMKSVIIQEHLLSPNKNKEIESQEFTVRDVVTQYLSHSGWLPGVSVI